jgi:acetate kinase
VADAILVLNAGSSSLKFEVFAVDGDTLARQVAGSVEELSDAPKFSARDAHGAVVGERGWPAGRALGHDGALAFLLEWLGRRGRASRIIAAGHRVVHGGTEFTAPVRVSPDVVARLEALVPLAPLHQPANIEAITALAAQQPALLQVACFDTAFHHDQPPLAQAFALPRAISDAGVKRYGFHGLSYEYVASVLPRHDTRAAAGRTVVLHLGNGASMCALLGGRSVATTMSFTALDGLPMGTRCGALDPGVVLYLLTARKLDAGELERVLYHESGLLGVSGVSSDMRVLLASADPRARDAVALFCYRIGRELGSLAAALAGLDAIVFTAGIGEHAAPVRDAVCRDAAWLGVELDAAANAGGGPRISTSASRVTAWVIPTDEELMIARHTRALLQQGGPGT